MSPFQKDFILRMIEMIGEFVALLLGLIKKGEIEEATKSLDNAYTTFLREDAAFFRNISINKLTDTLVQKHNYTNKHLEVLAGLFYAEAELRFAKEDWKRSREYYQKSLLLFDFVERADKAFSMEKQMRREEINSRIEEIAIRLNEM
ncbi:MAG: hypothetical protein JXB49_02075 [Bacteroidales bacterium]|nr:hypothetical protein [Bacteroidales bacterium]